MRNELLRDKLIHREELHGYEDIVRVMQGTAEFSRRQPLAVYIASKMDGSKKSLFQFFNGLFDRAKYVPVHEEQDIRTINKLWKDEKANCVDYSIAISSVLSLLRVPHGFVVCGESANNVSHVYIVAYPSGERVVMDCVLEQHEEGYANQNRPDELTGLFNQEVEAPFKKYFSQINIQDNVRKRI